MMLRVVFTVLSLLIPWMDAACQRPFFCYAFEFFVNNRTGTVTEAEKRIFPVKSDQYEKHCKKCPPATGTGSECAAYFEDKLINITYDRELGYQFGCNPLKNLCTDFYQGCTVHLRRVGVIVEKEDADPDYVDDPALKTGIAYIDIPMLPVCTREDQSMDPNVVPTDGRNLSAVHVDDPDYVPCRERLCKKFSIVSNTNKPPFCAYAEAKLGNEAPSWLKQEFMNVGPECENEDVCFIPDIVKPDILLYTGFPDNMLDNTILFRGRKTHIRKQGGKYVSCKKYQSTEGCLSLPSCVDDKKPQAMLTISVNASDYVLLDFTELSQCEKLCTFKDNDNSACRVPDYKDAPIDRENVDPFATFAPPEMTLEPGYFWNRTAPANRPAHMFDRPIDVDTVQDTVLKQHILKSFWLSSKTNPFARSPLIKFIELKGCDETNATLEVCDSKRASSHEMSQMLPVFFGVGVLVAVIVFGVLVFIVMKLRKPKPAVGKASTSSSIKPPDSQSQSQSPGSVPEKTTSSRGPTAAGQAV